MKRLAMLLPLVLSLGCQKADDKQSNTNDKPNIVGNGAGNLSGGGGVQAVRNAAAREVNDIELGELSRYIALAMAVDPKPPTADQIKQDARQNAKLTKLIKDEVIILTNSQRPDGIWAYTKWPQRGGKHYVIVAAGRDEKTADELAAALKAQGSEVKLAK